MVLGNGQSWKVVSGDFSYQGETEGVVLFAMQSKYYLSFMSSGAAVEEELTDHFTDTAFRPRYIDPNTVITTTNHGMWGSHRRQLSLSECL